MCENGGLLFTPERFRGLQEEGVAYNKENEEISDANMSFLGGSEGNNNMTSAPNSQIDYFALVLNALRNRLIEASSFFNILIIFFLKNKKEKSILLNIIQFGHFFFQKETKGLFGKLRLRGW